MSATNTFSCKTFVQAYLAAAESATELRANSVQRSIFNWQLLLSGKSAIIHAHRIMGCASSYQRLLRTPGSRLAVPICPLPEDLQDSNFLHVEASDSSKTITVVDGTFSLPRSSLAKPIRPLPEEYTNSELQVEVLDPSKTIPTSVGIFSLPAELICHILLLLHFKDLSCCVLVRSSVWLYGSYGPTFGLRQACKTFWHVAQNFADIQCLFELYAQGFTETPNSDWVDVSSKMYSPKRLASMWRSDFHLNPIFEVTVAVDISDDSLDMQSVKCGLWWMYADCGLFIRGCDTNTKPTQMCLKQRYTLLADMPSHTRSVVVDPLQDLAVAASYEALHGQDRHVFSVAFRLASSQRSHPGSACTSLKCEHPCYIVPDQFFHFVGRPAICGDRVVVLYYTSDFNSLGRLSASNIFIQVIDWRKGRAKGYPLYELGGSEASFHLLDEHRIIVVGPEGRMALYTFPELDGLPQCRIAYVLPNVRRPGIYFNPGQMSVRPIYVIHASPSFHGAAARSNLMPDYVTSTESQIMVLEVLSRSLQVILVVDMAIFSISVEIPWSEWGPKYARCFPHHPSHRISVFGSKMACALPQDRTPEPGQRLEELPAEGSFYVHIWDFNRTIAHSERSDNVYDCNSPDRLIRRPGRLAQTCFNEDDGDIITNHPYTTAVCPTGFSTRYFDRFFLEQDRLTLIWECLNVIKLQARPSSVQIQVVSPSPMMPASEVGPDIEQGRVTHSPELQQTKKMQARYKTSILGLFYPLSKLWRRPRHLK
ncbi:uncharacterized protein BJ212DRAFT_1372610 [Suillus subaureus]|uniref:Uncharacterized protein n=1 Tax=Suillus subaureus TaxID=48587 RepID=A0A9P7E5Y0_9AGAM|nr:uncharacterized protein BJ212DRAFT_1372610 [Suillus subaureus]KAG1811711.1 hypothetical protein BJ212DRAFT_1372610 [Suillus subaureus]